MSNTPSIEIYEGKTIAKPYTIQYGPSWSGDESDEDPIILSTFIADGGIYFYIKRALNEATPILTYRTANYISPSSSVSPSPSPSPSPSASDSPSASTSSSPSPSSSASPSSSGSPSPSLSPSVSPSSSASPSASASLSPSPSELPSGGGGIDITNGILGKCRVQFGAETIGYAGRWIYELVIQSSSGKFYTLTQGTIVIKESLVDNEGV